MTNKTKAQELKERLYDASEEGEHAEYREAVSETLKEFGTIDGVEFIKGPNIVAEPRDDFITATSVVNDLPVAFVKKTTEAEAKTASIKAHDAQKILQKLPISLRQKLCEKIGERLDAKKEELALLLTLDVGKSKSDAINEIDKSLKEMNWAKKPSVQYEIAPHFASENDGESQDVNIRFAKGVILNIVGYNYPVALAMPGIVGAIMTGNTTIIGPTANASLSNLAFGKILQDAVTDWLDDKEVGQGIKDAGFNDADKEVLKQGTISMVTGHDAKNILLPNKGVTNPERTDHLFFVGSSEQGLKFMAKAGVENCTLELGGNPAITVMASYLDKNKAGHAKPAFELARELVKSATDNVDQRCTGLRRLFVERSEAGNELIHELEKIYTDIAQNNLFYTKTGKVWEDDKKTLVGNPLGDALIGPLAKQSAIVEMTEALDKVRRYAAEIGKDKVKIVGGDLKDSRGNVPGSPRGTQYVTPALVVWDTEKDLKEFEDRFKDVAGSEIFAPILHVVKGVENLQEAIDLTNASKDGILIAGIYTDDPMEYEQFANGIKVSEHDTPSIHWNKTLSAPNPYGSHGGKIGGSMWQLAFTKKNQCRTVDPESWLAKEAARFKFPAMPLAA